MRLAPGKDGERRAEGAGSVMTEFGLIGQWSPDRSLRSSEHPAGCTGCRIRKARTPPYRAEWVGKRLR
jgi:hypothetical protein